jgi:hypothetical protein
VPGLAFLIAVVTLIPAEVWAHPAIDAEYRGFDPNLVYASNGGSGVVAVSAGFVDIKASANATPSINLLTTPLRRIRASVTVDVVENGGTVEPFRIGMWSPLNGTGYFVVFGAGPTNGITAETISGGGKGRTLVGGKVLDQVNLGSYTRGKSYQVVFLADREQGVISGQVFDNGTLVGQRSVTSRDFPAIFLPVRLSLTASAAGDGGSTHVTLRDYHLVLLHERFWASKAVDTKAQVILVLLAAASLLLVAVTIARSRNRIVAVAAGIRGLLGRARLATRGRRLLLACVAAAVAVYLVGNALLFQLGGQPFDMGGAKVFAYVGGADGPLQLYYLPNLVSLARIWKGEPNIEAGFPYGPVMAYLFTGIGWVHSFVLAGGGVFGPGGWRLEYLIKAVNVLFGLGDTGLIYLILRRIAVPQRWRLVAAALFLFNPAVWFSMSVWGQTHVISVFFVLLAIWLAECGVALWAWFALAAACLSRPQMLVFAFLFGIVMLRKFSWRQNAIALSWAVIVTFLFLLPLTFLTSPSFPLDVQLNTIYIQEAGGNDRVLTTVSQGAYSVWPLITYLTHGASGLARISVPSSETLIGPLSYQRASQILTILAMLLTAAGLLMRGRSTLSAGGYIPMIALGITSFLMLLTGIVSTHFLLALPFLVLSWRWIRGDGYFYVVAIWTITSLVTMYGDMGNVIWAEDYPLLAPANNAITTFFVNLYSWDRFMTFGVVGNVCAVVWLAFAAFRTKGGNSRQLVEQASG